MKFHPLADIFPSMSNAEFDSLKADIKEHGVREPAWVHEGLILDGRHRWRACEELGIDCPDREYTGDDPISFVISTNLHRRHLTQSQRAMIAARARDEYDKQAKERQKQSAGRGKKGPVNVPDLKGDSRDLAGKAVGVSGALVDRATKVLAAEPELIKAVEDGRIAVTPAADLAREPPSVQIKAAEAATGRAYTRRSMNQPDDSPKAEPTERQKDIAYKAANDAINILQKIGRENPLRAEAFKIVSKWMKHNA